MATFHKVTTSRTHCHSCPPWPWRKNYEVQEYTETLGCIVILSAVFSDRSLFLLSSEVYPPNMFGETNSALPGTQVSGHASGLISNSNSYRPGVDDPLHDAVIREVPCISSFSMHVLALQRSAFRQIFPGSVCAGFFCGKGLRYKSALLHLRLVLCVCMCVYIYPFI